MQANNGWRSIYQEDKSRLKVSSKKIYGHSVAWKIDERFQCDKLSTFLTADIREIMVWFLIILTRTWVLSANDKKRSGRISTVKDPICVCEISCTCLSVVKNIYNQVGTTSKQYGIAWYGVDTSSRSTQAVEHIIMGVVYSISSVERIIPANTSPVRGS
ncbi:hypothetical protein CBL_04314 [Carabus blaptoides fortunei]